MGGVQVFFTTVTVGMTLVARTGSNVEAFVIPVVAQMVLLVGGSVLLKR